MEKSVNKVLVTGVLEKVVPRKTKTGKSVASLTVALHAGNGQRTLVPVTAWQGQADRAVLMGVGSKVYITGHLAVNSWTDQQGAKRYKTEIISQELEEIKTLQSKPDADAKAARPISDEDIPF